MYSKTDFHFKERAKLWRDVLSFVEYEENVDKVFKSERNFGYELFKSVQYKSINIEEDLQIHKGAPLYFHKKSEVQYLLVFLDGQTIKIEQNLSIEKLYKPYELLNYPPDKDKEWLYNIQDLNCKHSVFSHLNYNLEILETCTRTWDIYKTPLHYENKWLLISTIDFLNAYMSDLVQAVNDHNMVKFDILISSKAILINELGGAYQISQDAALKILNLDKYGFSTKKNQPGFGNVYIEGVYLKTLLTVKNTHAPFHKFASYAHSKISSKEQLSNPFMLLSLVNVNLIESESLSNEISESQIYNENIEVILKERSIRFDNECKDPNKNSNNNNFIILASRTIDTNNIEKQFNDLGTISTNNVAMLSSKKNIMNKPDKTHLTSLEIMSRNLSGNVFKILATFEHLRCVVLSDTNIGPDGYQYLFQNSSIRELDLSGNTIGPEGCQYLSQNTSIRELDLSWNEIGPEECQYLSQNTSIRKLDLSWNEIGQEECQYLSLNTSIRELNLSNNNIGDEGCQYLSLNTSIRALDLSRNEIGSEGCQYLSLNTSIRELDLSNNKIGQEGRQYLSLNTSIRVLDLS